MPSCSIIGSNSVEPLSAEKNVLLFATGERGGGGCTAYSEIQVQSAEHVH